MTSEEYKAKYGPKTDHVRGLKYVDFNAYEEKEEQTIDQGLPQANLNVTWKSTMGPAKNEGNCGANWAFAATGVIEGNYFIKTGKNVSLSEQQLIDCNEWYQYSCHLIGSQSGLDYAVGNGLQTEAQYPYVAGTNPSNVGNCKSSVNAPAVQPAYYATCGEAGANWNIWPGNCTLAAWQLLLQNGPILSLTDGLEWSFSMYKSGIYQFTNTNCYYAYSAVVVAGWGVDSATGITYVLIRGFSGPSWGENGYMRAAVNNTISNTCFLTQNAWQPQF